MAFKKLILSFNAGELSQLLAARTDVSKYSQGCQRLENMVILPYGGALRRGGTEYLGAAKFADKRCRLIGFNFSVTTNFILEFGNLYVRFWSNGTQVLASGGGILELVTPYLESELREIQYCQINDLMYLVHPNHPPAKLTRRADNDWTYAAIDWDWPPTLEENDTDITMNPTGYDGTTTIAASGSVFKSGHAGSYWVFGINRGDADADQGEDVGFAEEELDENDHTSDEIRVFGDWELTTYGNWSGSIYLQTKGVESAIWETIRTYTSSSVGERNVSSTGKTEELVDMRFVFASNGDVGENNPLCRLQAGDPLAYGFYKINSITSATQANITIIRTLPTKDDSKIWAEAAFSGYQGYPRTVALHQQRLIFGGTKSKPLTFWGSTIDDFENFRYGPNEDNAIMFTLSANESNPICWMLSQQRKLLIGTAGDEWATDGTDQNTALSATNVQAQRQSSYGSAYLQARVINEVVFFAQRQGRKIREMSFAFEKDGWVAPDLCILSPQIADQGFVETAFAQQPDAIFWALTNLGNLTGMTYERDQQVVGWHRHSTQGTFESVATIYGGQNADEIWVAVKRTVNGTTKRYIERIKPDYRLVFEQEDKANYWFLDCAKRQVTGSPTATVTGLSHLEGLTVDILADGAAQPSRVVSGGAITLQTPAKNILVGLPFYSVVKPMNIDIPYPGGATAQGRVARIHTLNVHFYKSLCAQFSSDDMTWDEIFFREHGDVMDASPPVFTGYLNVATGANYRKIQQMSLRQNRPFPMAVLAMMPLVDFHGE